MGPIYSATHVFKGFWQKLSCSFLVFPSFTPNMREMVGACFDKTAEAEVCSRHANGLNGVGGPCPQPRGRRHHRPLQSLNVLMWFARFVSGYGGDTQGESCQGWLGLAEKRLHVARGAVRGGGRAQTWAEPELSLQL